VSELLRDLALVRRALVRRQAVLVLLGAAAAFAAAWGVAALGAWAGVFRAVRWGPAACWLAALGGLAFAVRAAVRAARGARLPTLREAAALVESELALRRGSLVGLVDTSASVPAGTSPAFVALQARRLALVLPAAGPSRWAPRAWAGAGLALRRRSGMLAGALLLAVAGFALAGEAAAVLASPLAAVRAGFGAVVEIAVTAAHVRRGGEVLVLVRAPGAVRPTLHVREPGEPWRPILLDADAAGRSTYRLRDIRATLHLFASAGGAASDTLTVRVLEPAFLTDFAVTASYPAYLARDDETLPTDAGPLTLPVGTVLVLRGVASAPLGRAALVAGGERFALETEGPSVRGRLVVRGTAAWHLALVDRAGFEVPEPLPTLDVRAVPDSAPVVVVPVPGADTTAALDLRQGVVVDARDDHGLARVELVSWRVSRNGLVGTPVVDTLAGAEGADHVVLQTVLDLNDRGLLPGDTLRFFVRASDRAPVPHVGASREFALRLRSMAELREAVRSGGDSLAHDAEDLASDQTALTRRTEDLAAQRARAGERPPDQLSFEQAQEATRIREEQEALLQRAGALRRDLADLARAAQEAGLNDPAWQQQLRDLDDLLRQAVTPELARRLEELRRALERLDPEAVRQALARLVAEQRNLRQELERSRELFERAAIEGALQTAAANAEALQRAEEQWAQRAPRRADSAAAAEEQRALTRELDSLSRDLRDLAERLGSRGDTAAAAAVGRQDDRAREARRAMDDAARAMSAGRRPESAQNAEQASESLRPVARELREQQRQLAAAWRREVMRLLDDALSETVTLATEQQRLARELREGSAGPAEARGRQAALQQGVDQVVRRLGQASGRNALVAPRLGASLGRARREMEEVRGSLEGQRPAPDAAGEQAGEAARSLSAAALEMVRNRETVAGSESGSGFAEALRRMAELAGQQGALSDQLGGLLPMLGGGDAVLMQLRALALRQRAIADQLERLGPSGLPGHPEQLAQEARDLADRLEAGRLDRQTLERQQRLFRRMLDAGRTLRNEDDERESERRSEAAREGRVAVPAGRVPRGAGLRYPPLGWEALRGLSPAERAMVLDYFRRLNAVVP